MSKFLNFCIVIASLIIATPALAVTEDYGTLLSGSYQPPATFATLSVNGSGNVYDFTLSAFDLNALFTTGAFIGAIAVNIAPDSNSLPTISNVVGGAPVTAANGGGPLGEWEFRFDLTGPQQARLTANESVSWTATFADPISFEGNQFALHVQGLTREQGGSAWYVNTPVPEPETYGMLLAGLGLIGFIAKRRLS